MRTPSTQKIIMKMSRKIFCEQCFSFFRFNGNSLLISKSNHDRSCSRAAFKDSHFQETAETTDSKEEMSATSVGCIEDEETLLTSSSKQVGPNFCGCFSVGIDSLIAQRFINSIVEGHGNETELLFNFREVFYEQRIDRLSCLTGLILPNPTSKYYKRTFPNSPNSIKEYQEKLLNNQDNQIADFRKIRAVNKDQSIETISPKSILMLHRLIVDLNISESKANQILHSINTILQEDGRSSVRVPSQCRTIRNYVTLPFEESIVGIKTFEIPFPKTIYGEGVIRRNSTIGDKHLSFKCVCVNILELIGQIALDISDSKNFVLEPREREIFVNDGSPIIEDYVSGTNFASLYEAVQKYQGTDVYPVVIGISMDETTINSHRSRAATPVYLYIYNLVSDDFKIHLVGFCPSDKDLPVNYQIINDYLQTNVMQNCGIKQTATLRDFILRHTLKRAKSEYLFHLLMPILDSQFGKGYTLQIGKGEEARVVNVSIHLGVIVNDNDENQKILGTSHRSKHFKCYICMSKHSHLFSSRNRNFVDRSDYDMMALSQLLDYALHQRLEWQQQILLANPEEKIELKKQKKRNDAFIEFCRLSFGIHFGISENLLYDLTSFGRHTGTYSLHTMCVPDLLHTFYKGIVESVVSNSSSILNSVQTLDSSYEGNHALVDKRIIAFPRHECTEDVVTYHLFEQGLSGVLNASIASHTTGRKSNKAITTSGLVRSDLEAQKLIPLLFQLLFSLGSTGSRVLPNNCSWYNKILRKHFQKVERDGAQVDEEEFLRVFSSTSIHQAVVNAVASTLEVYFFLGTKSLSENQITVYRDLVANATAHSAVLFQLFKTLSIFASSSNYPSLVTCGVAHIFVDQNSLKKHLTCDHSWQTISKFGANADTLDTRRSENKHKDVKAAFRDSAKRYGESHLDILKCESKKAHAYRIQSLYAAYDGVVHPEFTTTSTGVLDGLSRVFYFLVQDKKIEIKLNGDLGLCKRPSAYLHPCIKFAYLIELLKQGLTIMEWETLNNSRTFLCGQLDVGRRAEGKEEVEKTFTMHSSMSEGFSFLQSEQLSTKRDIAANSQGISIYRIFGILEVVSITNVDPLCYFIVCLVVKRSQQWKYGRNGDGHLCTSLIKVGSCGTFFPTSESLTIDLLNSKSLQRESPEPILFRPCCRIASRQTIQSVISLTSTSTFISLQESSSSVLLHGLMSGEQLHIDLRTFVNSIKDHSDWAHEYIELISYLEDPNSSNVLSLCRRLSIIDQKDGSLIYNIFSSPQHGFSFVNIVGSDLESNCTDIMVYSRVLGILELKVASESIYFLSVCPLEQIFVRDHSMPYDEWRYQRTSDGRGIRTEIVSIRSLSTLGGVCIIPCCERSNSFSAEPLWTDIRPSSVSVDDLKSRVFFSISTDRRNAELFQSYSAFILQAKKWQSRLHQKSKELPSFLQTEVIDELSIFFDQEISSARREDNGEDNDDGGDEFLKEHISAFDVCGYDDDDENDGNDMADEEESDEDLEQNTLSKKRRR